MSSVDLFAAKAATSSLVVGPHNLLTYNNLVLNDLTQLEHYRVEDFAGFEDADLRIADEDNTQEDGSMPGPGFYGSRTMTMSGFIVAGTYPKVIEMSRNLQDAFLDLVERPLKIAVQPESDFFTQPDVQIYCRKADKLLLAKKVEQSDVYDGMMSRGFTLALKATNPTYQSVELHEQEFDPATIALLGRAYSRSYDLAYDQFMDFFGNPITGDNMMSVVNAGNWYALPTITFDGYMNDVVLRNTVNSHEVRLSQPVPAGSSISINTYTGEIVDQNGDNRADWWDPASDWMRLASTREVTNGQNPLSLAVSDFDSSARMTFLWRDTYM